MFMSKNFKISICNKDTYNRSGFKKVMFLLGPNFRIAFFAGAQSMIKDPEKVQLKVNIDIRVMLVSNSYSCLFLL